jgi:glutamine synthetase
MELKKFDGNLDSIDIFNLLMLDIRGDLRLVTIPKEYLSDKVIKEGIGFDASNLGFAKVTDSDMVAIPDLSTGFIETADGGMALNCLCDVFTTDGESYMQYPRAVARKTGEYIEETGIADDARMLVELEFYLFSEVNYEIGNGHSFYRVQCPEGIGENYRTPPRFGIQQGYHRPPPQDRFYHFRNKVVATMGAIGIPVKYHHHEVAAGQLEIELDFMSLLNAADGVTLAKWIIKKTAAEEGLCVTFMPKPLYKTAGSGMHVHQYLEKDGRSLFPGDAQLNLTPLAHSYLCGILEHSLTGSLLALTNPSTNSYKRLVPGFEAPVNASFAKASRAAAIRIPGYLKGDDVRIEFRTGDATANIYYMLSAMVLAGLDGIQRGADPYKMEFDSTHKPKSFPLNLNLTLNGLASDREYLAPAFPESLLDLWIRIKREEALYVYNAPTPQEYELYF